MNLVINQWKRLKMSITKLPLKKVTYIRAHDADKKHTIVLGGESRWIRDIELLLEDQWKNIYCPEGHEAFNKTVSEHPPRICVVEAGAFEGNETMLFDLNYPKGTEKILITNSVQDNLSWKRTQRLMTARGVKCLELSSDSKAAAEEISEVLTGLCSTGFSLGEDLQTIQSAFSGYQINSALEDSSSLKVFKTMASKFVFDPNDIVAGTLLAETYSLWKKPKDANSSLQFAYLNSEASIQDENIFKLIEFSKKCIDAFQKNGDIDESSFQSIATDSGFGRLTMRMIKGAYSEVRQALSSGRGGLRLVKAA
jgi:hypothetical protein